MVTSSHMISKMATDQEGQEGMASSDTEQTEKTPILPNKDDQEVEKLSGCGGTLACDPRRPVHRYLVIIFMCLLSFGKDKSAC